jgi:hypothetical protein
MDVVLTTGWWVVLLAGLVPSGWVLARYRPARWREAPAILIRGLLVVTFLAYLRPLVSLVLAGGVPDWRGSGWQAAWSYGLLIATDLLLLLLLRTFVRYRRAYRAEMRRQNHTQS